ncbi:MAG TPA: ATP-binding cassette domain-containing protein, partial [Rugosimonospora sp.]|nr:ATP-binding cassette domain-containing protein [Rugosimonospora sp.]
LYPHMTVAQNIGFPLKLAKVDKAEIRERVARAAQILDLTPLLERKPANLSGGQRQRVAMGRAIVRSPKAFLMDEPLSNLDAKLRASTRTRLISLHRSLDTTFVYVTHDQTEAMTLGDRIVLMRAGVVQQVGPPQELYDHPVNLFVAGFIGSPAMNFLTGTLTADGVRTGLGVVPLGERLRRAMSRQKLPGEVIVGLRPEAFEDAAVDPDRGAATYTGVVDILESVGSIKYAFFTLDTGQAESEHLSELARDTGSEDLSGRTQLVTQLDPRSGAREGERLTVRYAPDSVHLFDPASGANLTEG